MNNVFPENPVDDYDDDYFDLDDSEEEAPELGSFGDNVSSVLEQYRARIETIVGASVRIDMDQNYPNANFILKKLLDNGRAKEVAWWTIADFPGCCGLVVSTGTGVSGAYLRQGLGTILNQMRLSIARLWGYTALVCTDIEQNTPQRKILAKNGWKDIHSFKNRRTGNTVHISVNDLEGVE